MVIYNPVSQSIVEQTNRADCASTGNKNVVFIGRIDPQKNIEHLIRAFGMVVAKRENINLIVVGDGVQKEKIVKLIAELNLEEKVQMVGVRRDIERIYEVADLVVLSSVYEGMPNCLIEAIAVGIPVVSYDCPIGPKEIIKDNQNGFLVPYNDMEALAIKIIEALDKKWDVKLIKETAEKFQVEKIAKEYLEIYDKV